jgi:hypothetical protein
MPQHQDNLLNPGTAQVVQDVLQNHLPLPRKELFRLPHPLPFPRR